MTESAREACLQGLATEWRTMTYTWRDCALYALAVELAHEEEDRARADALWEELTALPKQLEELMPVWEQQAREQSPSIPMKGTCRPSPPLGQRPIGGP